MTPEVPLTFDIRNQSFAITESIAKLPRDHRGFPVPYFVAYVDGKPEFRCADPRKLAACLKQNLCWVCGEKLEPVFTFVVGPMCAINLISAEPPSHPACAEFSAKACPFLAMPKAKRREACMPEGVVDPAGKFFERNPGVSLLWSTESFEIIDVPHGIRTRQPGKLFQIGEPVATQWYAEGRHATRAEVQASIDGGLPLLRKEAAAAGQRVQLSEAIERSLKYLPAH